MQNPGYLHREVRVHNIHLMLNLQILGTTLIGCHVSVSLSAIHSHTQTHFYTVDAFLDCKTLKDNQKVA